MTEDEKKVPEGWSDAMSEASSAAMLWGCAQVDLHKATVVEAECKARFLNAMARIDRIVRPLRK